MRVREDDIRLADGTPSTYGVVERSDFALVMPYEDGGFWLVEQFRHPIGRRQWEFPMGAWPKGHNGSASELARAELAEETGKRAGTMTHLARLFSSPGVQTTAFDVFLAEDLVAGEPDREATEADMICEWRSVSDLRCDIAAGTFADAHSVAAFGLFLLREV